MHSGVCHSGSLASSFLPTNFKLSAVVTHDVSPIAGPTTTNGTPGDTEVTRYACKAPLHPIMHVSRLYTPKSVHDRVRFLIGSSHGPMASDVPNSRTPSRPSTHAALMRLSTGASSSKDGSRGSSRTLTALTANGAAAPPGELGGGLEVHKSWLTVATAAARATALGVADTHIASRSLATFAFVVPNVQVGATATRSYSAPLTAGAAAFVRFWWWCGYVAIFGGACSCHSCWVTCSAAWLLRGGQMLTFPLSNLPRFPWREQSLAAPVATALAAAATPSTISDGVAASSFVVAVAWACLLFTMIGVVAARHTKSREAFSLPVKVRGGASSLRDRGARAA